MGLWWREIDVNVCTISEHHIEMEIRDGGNIPRWKAVGIYDWPEATNKHKTWGLMRNIRRRSSLPMVMFGDFNEILGMHENDGGEVRGERKIDAFRGAINDCEKGDGRYHFSIF